MTATDVVTGETSPPVNVRELVLDEKLDGDVRFGPDGHGLMYGWPFRVRRVGLDGTIGPQMEPLGSEVSADADGDRLGPADIALRTVEGEPHLLVVLPLEGSAEDAARIRIGTVDADGQVVDGPHDVDLVARGLIEAGLTEQGLLFVARTGARGTLDVYDHRAAHLRTVEVPESWSWAEITPDRRYLVFNDTADDSMVWRDLTAGREQVLPARVAPWRPMILPDGRALVWTREGSIDLWDFTAPIRIGTLVDIQGNEFTYPATSSDGGELWLALDGWFRRVPLDPDDWFDRACEVAGRALTAEEWTNLVPGSDPYRDVCRAE